jgi:signal peptidase II
MTRFWTTSLLLVLLLGTIGCDHATKHWAQVTLAQSGARSYLGNLVTLEYSENQGAFLSLGADWSRPARFILFSVGAALLLAFSAMALMSHATSSVSIVGIALFLGGGVSNLLDRLSRGLVIDFMNIGIGPVRTGIFNVADVAIMAGAALAAFSWVRRRD